MAPAFKGLGYGVLAIPTMMGFYYTLIMAWAFYFMFMGFRSELPWVSCNSPVMADFSTSLCFSKYDDDLCSSNSTFFNKKCILKTEFCDINNAGDYNEDTDACGDVLIPDVVKRITPSEEFFYRRMYGQTQVGVDNSWEEWGEVRWEMVGCLALCWTLIALSLIKGVQSYGKLSYFITIFPYIILTTFLIVMGLKDGFSSGISGFYMSADWEKMQELDVWVAACTQIFYSLAVGVGCQLLLCSYNKVNVIMRTDSTSSCFSSIIIVTEMPGSLPVETP